VRFGVLYAVVTLSRNELQAGCVQHIAEASFASLATVVQRPH
jgi:hypothetical protein